MPINMFLLQFKFPKPHCSQITKIRSFTQLQVLKTAVENRFNQVFTCLYWF